MTDKKFSEATEKAFKNVEFLLQGMINDRSVPRNIKRVATKGINILHERVDTHGVTASNVLYLVQDISSDPNIPFAARTTIYRVISILETIKD